MAALASTSPRILKLVLEFDGFRIEHEDDYNWALAKDGIDDVIVLPKFGRFVALDVLMKALNIAKMNNGRFLELVERAQLDQ